MHFGLLKKLLQKSMLFHQDLATLLREKCLEHTRFNFQACEVLRFPHATAQNDRFGRKIETQISLKNFFHKNYLRCVVHDNFCR